MNPYMLYPNVELVLFLQYQHKSQSTEDWSIATLTQWFMLISSF